MSFMTTSRAIGSTDSPIKAYRQTRASEAWAHWVSIQHGGDCRLPISDSPGGSEVRILLPGNTSMIFRRSRTFSHERIASTPAGRLAALRRRRSQLRRTARRAAGGAGLHRLRRAAREKHDDGLGPPSRFRRRLRGNKSAHRGRHARARDTASHTAAPALLRRAVSGVAFSRCARERAATDADRVGSGHAHGTARPVSRRSHAYGTSLPRIADRHAGYRLLCLL